MLQADVESAASVTSRRKGREDAVIGKLNLDPLRHSCPVFGLRMRIRGLHVAGDDVGVMVLLVPD